MIGSTCDDLYDAIPDVVLHLCILDELYHHVDVPDEILCELLSQDGDLEHQVVVDVGVHPVLQVAQQLSNNGRHVLVVADQIQQVKGSLTDRNITVIKVDQYLL